MCYFRPIRFTKRVCVHTLCAVFQGEGGALKKQANKNPFPSCWSYPKRGSLLLWTGQGWMGDPELLLPPQQGLGWGPSQHREVSRERHAVLEELQRKGVLRKSWTSRTSHTWSQSYPPLDFSLHEPIILYFALANLCNVVRCLADVHPGGY